MKQRQKRKKERKKKKEDVNKIGVTNKSLFWLVLACRSLWRQSGRFQPLEWYFRLTHHHPLPTCTILHSSLIALLLIRFVNQQQPQQ